MTDHKAKKADLEVLYQEKLAKLKQLENQKQTISNEMGVLLQEILPLKGKIDLLDELEEETKNKQK